MVNATMEDVRVWQGKTVVDTTGDRIGKIDDVYFDEDTGKPEWGLVTTGLFGSRQHFVPLTTVQGMSDQETITVPWSKDRVKDAPSVDPDGDLSEEEERQLYRHYGLDWQQSESTSQYAGQGQARQTPQQQARQAQWQEPGRGTSDAMTRSEEQLNVGTVRRPHELVRLRKHVVTENVTKTIPVSHEEVLIEREPITQANAGKAMEGPELSEGEHEVTLMHEEPVIEKKVVPKERVRLETDTVRGEEQVTEPVRREEIEVERDVPSKGKSGDTGRKTGPDDY